MDMLYHLGWLGYNVGGLFSARTGVYSTFGALFLVRIGVGLWRLIGPHRRSFHRQAIRKAPRY